MKTALQRILLPGSLALCVFVVFNMRSTEDAVEAQKGVVSAEGQVSVRILFGLKDRTPTRWDGSIDVSPGRVVEISGWRFEEDDAVDGTSGWKAQTRRLRAFGQAARFTPPEQRPMVDNGVIVELAEASDNTRVEVKTASGSFSLALGEIPYGRTLSFLDGAVEVDRVPTPVQLTSSPEEQDFPAAAVARDGTVWVAYVQFAHNAEHLRRRQLSEEPKDFSFLAARPGGDQVLLMKYSNGRWSDPMPVTKPGGDIYRCAVAVDGQGRTWVFWSENRNGNFDLYARSYKGGGWSDEVRLTTASDADINPASATDSSGRVWVVWQGFRQTNSDIFARRQDGDGFGKEIAIASTPANEWDPAIATSRNGDIAIAWDTYLKGDYDVYIRTAKLDGKFGAETLVAGSLHYEVRPSLTYDNDNRLWVAWEESEERWGKDFGAYETTGVGIYQVRNIGIKAFGGGRPFKTVADLAETLPGPTGRRAGQVDGSSHRLPNPELAKQRQPHRTPQPPPSPKNSFPRLTTDSAGRVCLAYRTIWPGWRGQLGTVWFENLVYYDGERWVGPIFIPESDNLLDNRPALVSLKDNRLMLVYSSDHRREAERGRRRAQAGSTDERFNNDLYAAEIDLPPAKGETKLMAVEPERPAAPEGSTLAEREDVKRIRSYRVTIGGRTLRLMRGEFHRHTEISPDGGGDGPLIDMWRYGLDAAALDWIGNGDHDNGQGREYTWWLIQKTTDVFRVGTSFVPMFTYERSVRYPEGHRNVVFARRGVRPLPRLQPLPVPEDRPGGAPDTQMLYKYLKQFGGICAVHTSATDMGTDWRDNDPKVEPAVEIYQGDRQNYEMPDAPRSNSEKDSIGGWRPRGFVSLALQKGYRLGFQASSDHISTHMSYCNVWVESPTREGILDGMKRRHIYGSTDNIIADVSSGEHFMGDEFQTDKPPTLRVKLIGTANFARVHVIRDNAYVYSIEPKSKVVEFEWRDNAPNSGRMSYYYVRGEQEDGELVWVSPMWIRYTGR